MELTVARVGKAHGLRGEVALDLRTDDPEERLAVGERLETRPATAGPLTVGTVRVHQGRWLVGFEGLRAEDPDGRTLGRIDGLEHLPAHDVLVLRETGGARTLVPFVRQIVPLVDVAGGRVVLDPPGGLLASDADRLEVASPDGGDTSGGDAREQGDQHDGEA